MDSNLHQRCALAFNKVERTILEGAYSVETIIVSAVIHATQFHYVLGDLTVTYCDHAHQFWYFKEGSSDPIKSNPEHNERLHDLKRQRSVQVLNQAKRDRQLKFADYILG